MGGLFRGHPAARLCGLRAVQHVLASPLSLALCITELR